MTFQTGRADAPVIALLKRLAERNDRAALSALRSSLGGRDALDALRLVLPMLGPDTNRRHEDDAVLAAGLFGLHPVAGPHSLAAALRLVAARTGSESVEARFRALLGASRPDLSAHLRHAVALVAAHEIGLNWDDLYRAIRYWDHDDDFVRRRWARDFWAGDSSGDDAAPEDDQDSSSEDPQQ